jgi:hypothetical protein
MDIETIAQNNFERHLLENSYPGRGLVVGLTESGAWVQVYWIMGRSPNSQNRRFVAEGGVLRTEPIDASKVANPELIIYEAMLELPGLYLVSNGDQTRTVADAMAAGRQFTDAICTREREPDAPHYTPRIIGILQILDKKCPVTLSILKANLADPELTDRFMYRPAPPPIGYGYGLTTYMGDGMPLPSFSGDPLILPCQDDAETMLDTYWQALDENNRVALAVKRIEGTRSKIVVRNR